MNLAEIVEFIGCNNEVITDALKNERFDDFEDSVISGIASFVDADYIITRNVKDFSKSKIPAIESSMFLEKEIFLS